MDRRSVVIAVVALVLIALAAVSAIYVTRVQTPTVSFTPTFSPTSTLVAQTVPPSPTTAPPSPTSAPAATPTPGGAITGRFGYPSDFIPAVTVYAISTTDPRVWYSVEFPGLGNPPRPTLPPGVSQPTYTITGVAAGTYWVVAYRNDRNLPDPGFYSRQVECFRATPRGPCSDINPAPVVVVSGQTTSGIDVITWGTQPQPSPTLPPRPTPR